MTTLMNILRILLLALVCAPIASAEISLKKETALYSDYGALLEKYATDTGVRYEVWAKSKMDLQKLDAILASWADLDLEPLSYAQRQAFYINLYNAGMLQTVFDYYPIKSITEILPDFGIFKKKFIKQGDRILSLDDVEKAILLKEYPDPRIHFAVNCASRSCPPLRAEPFISDKSDAQMEAQTRIYLNDAWGVQVKSDMVHISALFDWYKQDFPGTNPLTYINPYRKGTDLDESADVKFLEYDWALNTPLK